MPKIIENVRENILSCSKEQLLEHGYDALNIRAVARACGIAVGTVYNYFPSKEMLAASVMAADWVEVLRRMNEDCSAAQSVESALRALYDGVVEFSATYRLVWDGYTFSDSAKNEYGNRHNMLVRQLADCLRPVLRRFCVDCANDLDIFLAENIMICTGSSRLELGSFLSIVKRIIE